MKKIALIMDGWKRFFTYAWPAVHKFLQSISADIVLVVALWPHNEPETPAAVCGIQMFHNSDH